MNVKFKSVDNENNIIEFDSSYVLEQNVYIFDDKSSENTKIYLKNNNGVINIKREGNVSMNITLSTNGKHKGSYKNNEGLMFDFYVLTKELIIKSNNIYATYDLIIENDIINSHKMWILFH